MTDSLYEKAFNIIKNRRMKALQENERRIEEVNQKIPQIRVLNETLFNTSKELIKVISSGQPKDIVEKKINQIKKDNIDAQKISANLLKQSGYAENYLHVKFTCPYCNDTGYVHGSYCACLEKLVLNLKAEEFNRNTQLSLSSFDTFRLDYYKENYGEMKKILDYAKSYAYNFSKNSESILMLGETGLGKTHLSLAIANVVINKGFGVIYDSIINILQKIESEHFSYEHSTEIRDTFMNADLLIIDDLGTEYTTQFYRSVIYNIINTRINVGKPTIISTNLNYQGLKNFYEPRVFSRLSTMYNNLQFHGEDIRKQKKRYNIQEENYNNLGKNFSNNNFDPYSRNPDDYEIERWSKAFNDNDDSI